MALGKNGFAYYDTDTANYWVSGKPGQGNNGNTYRNDGVDVFADAGTLNQYYIGDIDAGEWLQYSLNVVEQGTYNVEVSYKVKLGQKSLTIGNAEKNFQTIVLPATKGNNWQKVSFRNLPFQAGAVKLRIGTPTGGMQLQTLKFIKTK